jgi:hypothetical protein
VDLARSDQLEAVATRLVSALPPERRAHLRRLTMHVEARDDLFLRVERGLLFRHAHVSLSRGLFQLAERLSRARAAELASEPAKIDELAAPLLEGCLAYLLAHALAHFGAAPAPLPAAAAELAADEALACAAVAAGFPVPGLLLLPAFAAAAEARAPLPGYLGEHRGYATRLDRLQVILEECPHPLWWNLRRP